MKKFALLTFTILLLMGCTSNSSDPQIQLRLRNVSSFDFTNIAVSTTGDLVSYENLVAGETSGYQLFELAYRYAYIELEINGQLIKLQPIDYVGETPLPVGFYTYELDVELDQSQFLRISLTLVED